MTRSFAMMRAAISLLVIQSVPAVAQRTTASADWRGVDRAIEAVLDSIPHADSLARRRRALRRFDEAVVASLNAGLNPDSINRIFARRTGYQGPTPGEMALRTSAATFWRELPRDAPSFYVAELTAGSPEVVIGVFQLAAFVNGPSAMSIYSRGAGAWHRSAGFSSDRLIAAFPIPARDETLPIATLETWSRADGSEGELKLWRFVGDSLRQVPRADTTRLQDAQLATTDSSLILTVSQFPRAVGACTMCTRLYEQHEILVEAGSVAERVSSLNPWAAIVEQLYTHLSRGQIAAARRMFVDSTMPRALAKHHSMPEFWADTGDFERGDGFVIVAVAEPNGCPPDWRIVSKRQPDNSWRIVSAEMGLWDLDKQRFVVHPKHRLPRACS